MLTLRDIHRHRRQQLLDFFSWRFGTPNYTSALTYVTGLSRATIENFRYGRAQLVGTLMTMEDAALQLGFRPARIVDGTGKFTPPKSLKLPRWSDAAVRIRFSLWRRETHGGRRSKSPKSERKPKSDTMTHIDAPTLVLGDVAPPACRTEV